jgi:hypothetical protein
VTSTSPGAPANTAWAQSLEALRSYRQQRGTADVARRVRAFGIDLGKWVAQCRDNYWDGELSPEQEQALEGVQDWQWGAERPGSWRHTYDALRAYAEAHGTAIVIEIPADGVVDLQAWAAAQRKARADRQLSKTQIERLGQLHGWHWDPEETRWRQGILAAQTYTQRHGSLQNVQRDTRLGAYPLGQWLNRCREDYRAGTLPTHRITELERLPGWKWGRYQDNWAKGFNALKRYAAKTGHASPSQHTVVNAYALGWWVTQRRRQYRQGTLPTEWAEALEALPGWQWAPLDQQWQRGLDALRQFVDRHGQADPPREFKIDDYPIGNWVRAQRDAYARGSLSSQRAAELKALPGWYWSNTERSDDNS